MEGEQEEPDDGVGETSPIFVLFENWRVHNGEMRAGGRISEGGKLVGKMDGESRPGQQNKKQNNTRNILLGGG